MRLEYSPTNKSTFQFSTLKCPHAGLNHGPQVYKTCALPLSYTGQWNGKIGKIPVYILSKTAHLHPYMAKTLVAARMSPTGHLSPCKSCCVRIAKFVHCSWLDRLCSRVLHISDTVTVICPHGEVFSGAVRCRRS